MKKTSKKSSIALTVAALLALALSSISCAPKAAPELSQTEFVLGTVCSIRVLKGGDKAVIEKALLHLHELEDLLSVNKPGSQIDAVNAAAGKAPVAVGPEAMDIVKRGLHYAKISGGSFDPSVGPLVKLWGIGSDHARLPSPKEIAAADKLVNWKDISVDEAARTIFLARPGMGLDLGSATKGYAADEVAKILKAGGVKSAVIDLGGNVLVVGAKPDGKSWRVGLQDPEGERGSYIGIATLKDQTMVTSGVYERFFIQDGVRYHHILDTKTGYPVQNGLVSVTVIAAKSFDADGVTTMLFSLGRERGMALARELKLNVIMLDKDHRVYITPGVSSLFEITDSRYSLAE